LVNHVKDKRNTNKAPLDILPLLHEFADVFIAPKGIPPSRAIAHSIDLILGASLPNAKSYRLSPKEAMKIKKQIGQHLESNHIQPSSSPYTSPAFIIPNKETSKWCLITDYCSLNKETIKNRYLLPWIEDFLDHLKGASFFTKMDLDFGYHPVCMQTTYIWKTTFKAKFCVYKWLVMLFGLTNFLATFMRPINDIF
jgi:hypothetical protein